MRENPSRSEEERARIASELNLLRASRSLTTPSLLDAVLMWFSHFVCVCVCVILFFTSLLYIVF